jgi:hypothetical protein
LCSGKLSFHNVRDRVWVYRSVYSDRSWADAGVDVPKRVYGESEQDLQLWELGRIKQ